MAFPQDQIDELKQAYNANVALVVDAGKEYLLIQNLPLPNGCSPTETEALLCPTTHSGYTARLFFAKRIQSSNNKSQLNWNASGVRIAERVWHAFSWKDIPPNLRLLQLVEFFLRALR